METPAELKPLVRLPMPSTMAREQLEAELILARNLCDRGMAAGEKLAALLERAIEQLRTESAAHAETRRRAKDDAAILEQVKEQLADTRKQNEELRRFAATKASDALSTAMAWQDIDDAVSRFAREPFSKAAAAAVGAARTKWQARMAEIEAANRPKEGSPT